MFGLIKDLAGMLNQLSLNTLKFQLIERSPRKGLTNSKNKDQK